MPLPSQLAYSVVGFHGSGFITYREAMAAVFMEGYALTVLQISAWPYLCALSVLF